MSIENEIAGLTQSTTDLLEAVNTKKSTLDSAVDTAEAAKVVATSKAAEATTVVADASTHATNASNSATQAAASAASASQIVTGVATGLPNIRPSLNLDFVNSKRVDPRIDFTRSTTATYYDGKTVAKAEENLFANSENISSWISWYSGKSADVTTAPNGTTTADKIVSTASDNIQSSFKLYTYGALSNTATTYSIYLKAAGYNYGFFGIVKNSSSIDTGMVVDLTTGVITDTFQSSVSTRGTSTFSVQDVGDGWYRCIISCTDVTYTSNSGISAGPSDSATPNYSIGVPRFLGDGTSGTYVWGAQVEHRDFATAYTPTTDSPITNYVPVLQTAGINEPRLDHDPVTGECKGLLMEGSRVNIYQSSENLSNFGQQSGYTDYEGVISPLGTKSLRYVVTTKGYNQIYPFMSPVSTIGATYTSSIFLKIPEHSNVPYLLFQCSARSPIEYAIFDVANEVFTNLDSIDSTATATKVGNGWWRFAVTQTAQVETPYYGIKFYLTDDANNRYAGVPVGTEIYFTGMQVEQAPFPSSYIPTDGATVTRGIESSSISGSAFTDAFNNSEFSLYAEMQRTGITSTHQEFAGIELSDSTSQKDVLSLAYDAGSFNRPNARLFNEAGSMTVITGVSGSAPNFEYGESVAHFALGVKQGSSLLAFNGTLGNNNPSTITTPFTPEHLRIQTDNIRDTFTDFYGYCRKVSLYNKRLADSELQALTQE